MEKNIERNIERIKESDLNRGIARLDIKDALRLQLDLLRAASINCEPMELAEMSNAMVNIANKLL